MRIFRSSVLVLVLGTVLPAQAQWAVFDAGNFTKNTLTALQTAQQYAQLVQSYMLQAQQFANMVTNTKSLAGGLISGAIGRQIQAQGVDMSNPGQVVQAATQLYNVYSSTNQMMQQATSTYERAADFSADMNRVSGASGLSWTDVLSTDLARLRSGRQASAGLYQQATQVQSSLADIQTRADQQLQVAGQAEGAVQAIQAVAMQNHTLSDQVSTLVTLSASQQQNQAVKDQQDLQDREKMKIRAGQDRTNSNDALRLLREFR